MRFKEAINYCRTHYCFECPVFDDKVMNKRSGKNCPNLVNLLKYDVQTLEHFNKAMCPANVKRKV